LKISEENLLLVFQGGGIHIDKGGEELIEAVSITENVSLIIVGSGDVLHVLKQKVSELDLSEKVRFIPKIPWEDLIRYTKSADVGMSLEKDTNLNYWFSIPNKLFDYISAGIPVITGTLPEIKKIVEENNCGLIIPDITPEKISNAIKILRDHRDLLNRLKQNAVNASKSINWENESVKVTELYKEIITNGIHKKE
jgi:glycosyltransferase involved in cell wall biosynthesis